MAKIMLVEDDNNLREIYEARLQAEGYTLVAAKDGEEALVLAKNEKPDLIISDVMMPKISGFEMLDILRNTEGLKEVKIIMLTALGQSDDQQRADRLGADRYLVKSQVTLEDIVKVAHDLLQDAPAAPEIPEIPAAAVEPIPVAAPVAAEPVAPVAPAPLAVEPVAFAPAPAPVAAEPVVAAPVPEPVAPVAAPATVTAPPAADTSGVAQSTAQEEAGVEAQIENFVEGASSDPTTTTSPEALAAAIPVAPAVTAPAPEPSSAPTVPTTEAVAPNDQLMAQAVDNLAADTAAAPAPAPTPITIAPPTEPVAAAPVASAAPVAETPPEPSANGSVPIAHKKIIAPLDSAPKQDLGTLLALEEAKEAAAAGPPPPTAVVSTNEAGPQAQPLVAPPAAAPAPAADNPLDPNNIAL